MTDNTNDWHNKGDALIESGIYAEAIKCYEKAIELDPASSEILNKMGLALARSGKLGEAGDALLASSNVEYPLVRR